MKIKLNENISSPQDLKSAIQEVKQYAGWYAHAAIKKQVSGKAEAEAPDLSPGAAGLIRDLSGDKQLTPEGLDEIIEALRDFEASAKQISITLAAAPSNGLKKTLTAWCRQNISPNVLINFQFNSALLGGLVVRCGSRIFDWSFRPKILAARERIPEVLRHV